MRSRCTPSASVDARDARRIPVGFSYNSGDNADFLSVEQLRELIAAHIETDAVGE